MGLFDRFRPRGSPATVISELVSAIFIFANQSAKAVVTALEQTPGPPLDPNAGSRMLFDFVFFNYQWVDRVAYNTLREERDGFMDALRAALIVELGGIALEPALSEVQRKEATEDFQIMLDEFLKEFGSYNATPASQGGEMRGTLFYEMGRRVAHTVGRPRDSRIIALASLRFCAISTPERI